MNGIRSARALSTGTEDAEYPKTARAVLTPIRDAAGELSGFLLLSSDRSVEDAERRKAEEKFRGLLESAPDAMVIVDRAGRITIVNSQTEKLFGYHRDELLGQRGAARWIWAKCVPLFNDAGEVGSVTGLALDTTERKNLDQ